LHFKIKHIKGHSYLYLIENQRVDGVVKQVRQVCVGSADKVQALLEGPKDLKVASFSFGKPAALLLAAQELGVLDSLDEGIGRKDMEGLKASEYLLTALIGRADGAYSRSALASYFKGSLLQFVLEPEHSLQAQNFLNYMERLDEELIQHVEADISASLLRRGFRPSMLIFDTTNFYTYVEEGLPCKGSSKDKRYDRNLVGVGLTISDEALPFQSFTYPANQHDSNVFSQVIGLISERLKKLDVEGLLLVMDRGMLSEGNLDLMRGMRFLSSLPYSMAKEYFPLPLDPFEERWARGKEEMRAHRLRAVRFGREVTLVVKYNPATARKQEHEWKRNKEAIMAKVEELRSSLKREGKGRKISAKGLINRLVDAIPRQYRGLFQYSAVRTEGKLELKFQLEEEEERLFLQSFGRTVLMTDDHEMTTREIVDAYVARNSVEEDFKWLKGRAIIPLKPMFVRTEENIRAHVFLCVLGLLLYNFIRTKLRKEGMEISMPALAERLDDIRLALLSDGLRKPRFVIEEMDADSVRIFEILGLRKLMPQ
jgi:transposase